MRLPSLSKRVQAGVSEDAGALLSALAHIYPERPIGTESVSNPRLAWAFLPNASRPRLLVPVMPKKAVGQAVRRFSAATQPKEHMVRRTASALLGLTGASLLPDVVQVGESQTGSLLHHLSDFFGQRVAVAIGVGTARANRKPVLAVFDQSGRQLAFVKLGVDEASRTDVQQEARSLSDVEGRLPSCITAPRLLEGSWWRGHYVLIMTDLSTKAGEPRGRRGQVPGDYMLAFSRAFSGGSEVLGATQFWERLRERVDGLVSADLGQRVGRAFRAVEERDGDLEVEEGAWHGDWAPWNMSWHRGGIHLWDFERFDQQGVVGLDHLHYAINQQMSRHGASMASLAKGLSRARQTQGLTPHAFDAVAGAYLCSIAARYVDRAEGMRGELIAPRAAFMVEALEAWVVGAILRA